MYSIDCRYRETYIQQQKAVDDNDHVSQTDLTTISTKSLYFQPLLTFKKPQYVSV